MGTFLFLLFLIFIVYPIVAALIKINRFKRQARRAYEEAYGRKSGHGSENRQRKAGWSDDAPKRKKKIDPDVGEYVKYEELEVERTYTESSTSTRIQYSQTEQQISDAEWEDIK